MAIHTKPVDLNKFWEKTPTILKYILVLVIFLSVSYFIFSKNLKDTSTKEIETMKTGINATYELIDNFETFRNEQNAYNKEVLNYLEHLHTLVQELNINTNRKLDMILQAGGKNADQVIEKIMLLNESFERLSKAYQNNLEAPKLDDAKMKSSSQIVIRKINKSDTIKK